MNNMNFKVPFYGKKGTIKNIQEDARFYIVYRYGLSEDEETVFYVPKNDNNLKSLLDNYYSDLKEYLDFNSERYETYKKTRLKKGVNINLAKGILGVSSIMILSSVPLISSHETIGFLGVFLDTLAVPGAVYAVREIVKDFNDDRMKRFIKLYSQYTHKYNKGVELYNNNSKTIYKGLSNENDKDRIVELNKKKVLRQNIEKSA